MSPKQEHSKRNISAKRLRNNLSRSIVLTKPTTFWIFVHVYEKQDKANIAVDELRAFKKLAKDYERGGIGGIELGLKNESLKEICHDQKI